MDLPRGRRRPGFALRIPRVRVLLVVALLAGLAGCSEEPGPAAMPPPSDTPGPTAPPPSPQADMRPAESPVAVAWQGSTKEGAWVCAEPSGVGQCPAGQQVLPDGAHVTALAYEGNLTGVDVVLEWRSDPSQTGLVFAAYGNTSAGRGYLAHVQGDSPLRLALEADALAGLVGDGSLVLMVWPEGKTPTEPSVFVDATRQPFSVTGTLTVRG